ncbi:MAG: molybdenum cofactor guanylyltransferase, partial [Melioribacteraceae bacterium]|nr:molybdenum cofactor guanylyltransferase [Melioribacteraceae bacterium]
MKRDITAVILAGGNSSRMGLNKSLLKINNSSFIDRTIILLENIFDDIIIVSNSPEDYTALGLQIFQDVYPGFGPLAGIHSGLMNSNSEKVFVVSNDLPFLNR